MPELRLAPEGRIEATQHAPVQLHAPMMTSPLARAPLDEGRQVEMADKAKPIK